MVNGFDVFCFKFYGKVKNAFVRSDISYLRYYQLIMDFQLVIAEEGNEAVLQVKVEANPPPTVW